MLELKTCILVGGVLQFGVLIGESRERHAEWRRSHPEWWWWDR